MIADDHILQSTTWIKDTESEFDVISRFNTQSPQHSDTIIFYC